jgi:phosphatidate cytidylyltransferase
MLWQRLLTAAVGIPILLGLIYFGDWYLGAAVLLLSLLGLREFFRLAQATGLHPGRWIGYIIGALLVIATSAVPRAAAALGLPPLEAERELAYIVVSLLVLAAIALLVQQVASPAPPAAMANAGLTLLGLCYLPLSLSYLIKLRGFWPELTRLGSTRSLVPAGACWLVLVVFACWAADTTAYAIGKTLGRHHLCPKISPGKTVEGAVAALLAALLVTAALGRWFGLPLREGVILGLLLGLVAQLGDLSKSVMKRQAGVKDSGAILPGHGGVLDRFDSLLFSAPVAFYYLILIRG